MTGAFTGSEVVFRGTMESDEEISDISSTHTTVDIESV
jgi:hypothetical protein